MLWHPIHLWCHAQTELHQQLGGSLQVVQADDLDRAVHVAVGDADQAGSDAVARKLDGVGVGPGSARDTFDLNGNLLALGDVVKSVEDMGVDVRPSKKSGASADLGLT